MKITEALRNELAQWLDTYWTTYLQGDIETWATFIRDDYRNIGGTKEEIWNSKQEIMDYTYRIMDQMLGTVEIRNRQIDVIPYGQYMMVHEFTDLYVKIEGVWTLYGPFRMSSLLEKTDRGWIALHQHGSYPDMKAMEGEAFSYDAIKAENVRLQEAVKSRTIELEIEAALERVRAVAMGMKKPGDMLDVCRVISDQLQQFGVKGVRNVQTVIINENIGQYLCYQYFPSYDQISVEDTEYHKSPVEHEMVNRMLACCDGHFIGSLMGEKLDDFKQHRKEENHFRDPLLDEASELGYCFLSIGEGGLGLSLYHHMNDEVLTLFKRFHQVFSLAYQRFRDIQKAEDQAREAQIQLSLERVRARSLAMQSSDELHDVLSVLFRQFDNLGIQPVNVFLSLFDRKNRTLTYRASGKSGTRAPGKQVVEVDSMKPLQALYDKWINDNSDSVEVIFYPKEVLPDLFGIFADTFATMPEEDRMGPADFPEGGYSMAGYTPFGYLGYDHQRQATEEEKDILSRFCLEFTRVYQRFLDIQKAEAQSREAQIQLSLERVRARSMAMQSSDELSDVLSILFQQFDELGIKPLNVWLSLYNLEENIFIYRATGTGGTRIQGQQVIDINAMDIWKDSVEQWKSGHADPVLVTFYPPEVLPQLMEVFKETFDVMPEEERMDPKLFPEGGYNVQGYTKFGYIGYNHLKPPTQEEKDILRKFATEFERVYQRFLDIEKAEAQAREAQIEAALERVRSASMAMHQTEDIGSVVQVYFEQLKHLDIPFEQAWITILHLEEGYFDTWFSPIDGIYDKPTHFKIPSAPFEETAIKNWKSGVPFSYLSLKTKSEVDQFLFACDEMTNSKYFSHIQKKLKIERLEFLEARHKFGFLSKTTLETPAKEDEDILLRFASVFEQTYTRFLDIQKAEAQAKEAQIEAALEKVRSHSLAMQSAAELQDVVTIVGEKLKELGVVLDSGGVVICTYFPDSKDVLHWTATFDSSHLSVPYYLPYFDTPIWKETWHSKFETVDDFFEKVYSFEDKNHFFHYAFKHSDYKNLPDEYKKALLESETHALSFAWQTNSALMIASHNGMLLPEEHKIILKRFAKVFEQAFIRFMDLQKAEKQTRESQIELSLERVRAKAMAMHQSGELSEVLSVLFDQFDILGINPVFAHLSLIDLENNTFTYRMTGRGGKRVLTQQVVDLNARDEWKDSVKAFKKGKPNTVSCLHFPKEALPQIWELFNETLGALPKGAKIYQKDFPDGIYNIQGYCKYGYIGFNHNRAATEEEKDIVVRFATEFGRMYQRFLDIQKAEAQAREAQIETALERVRARSMAMHQTDELNDVLCVLLEQFDFLGINPVLTHLTLFDEANEKFSLRLTTSPTSRILVEQIIDIYAVESWKASYENWKKGIPNTVDCIDYPPEALPAVWEVLSEVMNALPEGHKINPVDFPDGLFTTQGHFKFGYLGFNHRRKATAEEKTLVSRFATEFGRAYQRFLDIQKAEAQAREAQIEAALERVRSRSMGMQNTTEMQQVANETREQLLSLGLKIDALAMSGVIDNEADYDVWVGGAISQKPLRIPYNNNTRVQRDYNKVIKERPELFTKTYSGKIMKDYFRDLMATNTFNPEIEKFMLECKAFTTTLTFMKNSGMQIVRYTDQPFSDADNNIVIRFGKVFEQAYIRFLDLQKAEAQGREAQIEAALERVRSRTMAMRKSEELLDVASILFQQVKALGVPQWNCGFNIWEIGDEAFIYYPGTPDGIISQSPCKIPLNEHPVFQRFDESRRRGDDLLIYEKEGEEQVGHYQYMLSLPGVGDLLQNMLDAGFEFPVFQIDHIANFAYGNLIFITYEHFPDMHEVFKRFAKVFEQTYTRFLDLQKAEAQAREAHIEAALERTRTQSMLMQHSGELNEISKTFHQQLLLLGIDSEFSFVWLPDEEKNEHMFWATWVSDENGSHQYHSRAINFPLDKTEPGTAACYVAWESGVPAIETYVAPGDIVSFFATWEELLRGAEKLRPEFFPDGIYYTEAYMKYGCFGIDIRRRLAADEKEIIRRFAVEFERTYTRFLDLKKAEAQALEAIKRASVDRVRAEIASMRTTSDLERIQPLIWNELKTLDVPFIRCGVFIMDEAKQELQAFLSTPDGKSIAAFHLQYHSTEQSKQIVAHWQQKQLFKDHMDEKAFADYTKNLVQQGAVASDEKYVTENRPTDLYLYFLPFLQGMLYVGNDAALKDDEIQLVQNLADAFSTAYARYEDFNKLEAAKKQVDSTLNELQATQKQLVQSEKMASLGELTAGIAHEIQNPLNFVNNFSEVSKELLGEMKDELAVGNWQLANDIASDVEQNLDKIHHHGKRADAIVKGMLLHSRTGSGQMEPTDLNALCDEYLRLAYHGLKAKDPSFNASFHFEPDDSLPKINVVPQDIGRVLLNLINNAFQACGNADFRMMIADFKPMVFVSTKKLKDKIEISVKDNGPGIPDAIRDKIFQPFFTTKPTGQGTGLGLSLSYDIVKAHGGELTVKTKEGEGSEFFIKLPGIF